METNQYKRYITGLKGTSCVLIMAYHYLGLYKYAQQFQPRFVLVDTLLNSSASFILDEGYWLYLFFVVSGYLVAKSHVNTISDVIFKSLTRFMRFAFPIFFSYLVIYLIYNLIGFHNGRTTALFQCDWYQSYYSGYYSISDVLISPIDVLFFCKCSLNSPYWVLRNMFISSIIIYILKYSYVSLSKKNETICLSILIAITYISYFVSTIIFSCLIGMMISIYENEEDVLNKPCVAFWAMVIAMALYVFPRQILSNFFFASLIVFIPKVKPIDHLFSSKPLVFLGKISWGIYSFHWPLMCSLGAILIINLQPQIGLSNSYGIACILVAFVNMFISVIFYFTFERLSNSLSVTFDKRVKQIASR